MTFAPARQLLSGPDVGGGYLLQLSQDREPEVPGFTYHLQEGGIDAAAPPADSVEWLGFARSDRPCMFGGNRCWERHFPQATEPANALRNRYNRFRFVLGPLLEQRAGHKPVPLVAGLKSLLQRIAAPLEADRIPWELEGPSAAWVRGSGPASMLVEIGTTGEGCVRLGLLLADSEIWPVAPGGRPPHRSEGAAFLGTFVDGLLVRWSEYGVSTTRPERASWEGFTVPLSPR
ncbi:MAG: hypothetical protein L3K04_02615 [Thermoplasmata archaeon]|nr:hypothetical protein [Thermoplasmata archaeon]MCI4341542.1 hypothetical protein [Thermoplasmata archaeon]